MVWGWDVPLASSRHAGRDDDDEKVVWRTCDGSRGNVSFLVVNMFSDPSCESRYRGIDDVKETGNRPESAKPLSLFLAALPGNLVGLASLMVDLFRITTFKSLGSC